MYTVVDTYPQVEMDLNGSVREVQTKRICKKYLDQSNNTIVVIPNKLGSTYPSIKVNIDDLYDQSPIILDLKNH